MPCFPFPLSLWWLKSHPGKLRKDCPLHNPGLCVCMAVMGMLVVGGYALNFLRPHNVCVAFEQTALLEFECYNHMNTVYFISFYLFFLKLIGKKFKVKL